MNPVIINAAIGSWYPKGTDRLLKSLKEQQWSYDILSWKNESINEFFKPKYPYTIKAAAFAEAMWRGYTNILWLDCSVWAVKKPDKFADIIEDEGGYFWKSGYNLAQTATDADLSWAGITRDEAERMPEVASNMFGINLNCEKGKVFLNYFLDACNHGVFNSSRHHDNASSDERFLFGRQDQTAASLSFHKAGFTKIYEPEHLSCYYYPDRQIKKSVILTMQGM